MIPEAAVVAAKVRVDDAASINTIRAILDAAEPHMLADMRHQSRMQARATRSEANGIWAEQTRADKADAWDEAMARAAEIAWERDICASSAIKVTPNPYRRALGGSGTA